MVDSVRLTISGFNISQLNWSLWGTDKRKKRSVEYKGIVLQLYLESGVILLICNAHKILNKKDICISDLKEFERRINDILKDVVLDGIYNIELNRLDFYSDVFVPDDYIFNLYMNLLLKHRSNFLFMKEKEQYSSSKHISTGGSGSRNFNIYDKHQEQKSKGIIGAELEQWKNIIRIEEQFKKMYFKRQYKNFGILPILANYWNENSYQEMYSDLLNKYFYCPSKYYKLSIAQDIVNNNDKLSFTMKKNINKFLRAVELVGMEKINNYYNKGTIQKYCELLVGSMGINPISLKDSAKVDSLDNLFELAKNKAKKDYLK